MPGGFAVSSSLTNYFYNSTNGIQVNAHLTSVQTSMTTGNNFVLRSFGEGTNQVRVLLGHDDTTHTRILGNGIIEAVSFSASNLVQGATLSSTGVVSGATVGATLVTGATLSSTGLVQGTTLSGTLVNAATVTAATVESDAILV
jgi:hypothetical protein